MQKWKRWLDEANVKEIMTLNSKDEGFMETVGMDAGLCGFPFCRDLSLQGVSEVVSVTDLGEYDTKDCVQAYYALASGWDPNSAGP